MTNKTNKNKITNKISTKLNGTKLNGTKLNGNKLNGKINEISRLICWEKVCKIDYVVSGSIYFIEDLKLDHCPYVRNFGNSNYCTCQDRIKLFKKYGI